MPIAMPVADRPATFVGDPAPPATPNGHTAAPGAQRVAWTPAGRLRDESLPNGDRGWAVAIHLSPFAWIVGAGPLALLAPLVIWLIRKGQSPFNDDHGREAVNFLLSFVLLHALLLCTIIGVVLWPVLWVVAVVSQIRAAVAAGNGEYFRYPLTWRFLS